MHNRKTTKPAYQKIIQFTIPILSGLLAFGGLLDAISNAITLITFKIATTLTLMAVASISLFYIFAKNKKIIWVTEDYSNTIITKINKNLKLNILGGILLLWLPVLLNTIREEDNKIFSRSDKSFKVLILPFQKIGDAQRNIPKVLKGRLESISRQDSLDIKVHCLEINSSLNFPLDSLDILLSFHNADLIVFGQYLDKDATKNNVDKYLINYKTAPKWLMFQNKLEFINTEENDYQEGFIEDIQNGKLSGEIEFIVYYLSALINYSNHNFDKVITIGDKMINSGYSLTSNAADLFGCSNLLKKNHFQALKIYTMAILADSIKSKYYNNRGVCFLEMGLYSRAIIDFDKSIRLDSSFLFSYLNKGLAFIKLGETTNIHYDSAINSFTIAIRLYPKDYNAYFFRASVLGAIGEFSRARQDFKTAKVLNPTNKKIAERKKMVEKIESQFSSILTQFQPNFDKFQTSSKETIAKLYFKRGEAFANSENNGLVRLAINDFNKAIEIMPENTTFRQGRAFAFAKLCNYDKSFDDLNRNIELLSNKPFAQSIMIDILNALKESQATLDTIPSIVNKNVQLLEDSIQKYARIRK